MKKLLTMMTVCCMLMLSGCSKSDDGGTDTPQVTDPTTQAGTWISTNTLNEVELAMTFSTNDYVLINLEGLWFFGSMERQNGHLSMRGSRIVMESFTDFGTYTAKIQPLSITINCDYRVEPPQQLVISNITTTPHLQLALKSTYRLRFDKVYRGESAIF
jgi:hypothetical protein